MVPVVRVLMISELTVRLPEVWMVAPEVKALANSTSLVLGGTALVFQLAAVPQPVLPGSAPPSQMVVTAKARAETKTTAAARSRRVFFARIAFTTLSLG